MERCRQPCVCILNSIGDYMAPGDLLVAPNVDTNVHESACELVHEDLHLALLKGSAKCHFLDFRPTLEYIKSDAFKPCYCCPQHGRCTKAQVWSTLAVTALGTMATALLCSMQHLSMLLLLPRRTGTNANTGGSSRRSPKREQETETLCGSSGAGQVQLYLPTGFVARGPSSAVRNRYILILLNSFYTNLEEGKECFFLQTTVIYSKFYTQQTATNVWRSKRPC